MLNELVDDFEVGDACKVLSFIRVDFTLGHAIISRGGLQYGLCGCRELLERRDHKLRGS